MGGSYRADDRRVWLTAAAIGLVVLVGFAPVACSSEHETVPPEVSEPWERTEAWAHRDVVSYDNVAVSTAPQTVAWFTRRTRGEVDALAYREIHNGGDAIEIDVPTPGDRVLIPVGVASDNGRWAAVAVTREAAQGANVGLMAWTGESATRQQASSGELLPVIRDSVPESVSAARAGDVAVVAALLEERPAIWRVSDGGDAWEGARPALDLDEDLVNLRVIGDGEGFVLAGVDVEGAAHLWVSADGVEWEAVSREGLPDEVGSVGLLAPLERGRVAVGWLDDEDSAPFNATAATIQTVEGRDVEDMSTIAANGDGRLHRIDLGGATLSPDGRVVVVGAALRSNGTTTPMVWVGEGDKWVTTEQAELIGRLDYQLRAVTTTHDDTMVGLVAGIHHIDVEAWLWRPSD